ncbi:hypothetical protein SDC9_40583 [bioreactor metagenome]|uniref:Uncharacterized protein n=1 Tax=bioreactor metagenome TaxID=1076179 RepID=A0A644VT89_9ZZZZ
MWHVVPSLKYMLNYIPGSLPSLVFATEFSTYAIASNISIVSLIAGILALLVLLIVGYERQAEGMRNCLEMTEKPQVAHSQ